MKLHEEIALYYPAYHEIQHYPKEQCACIRGTKDQWGILGNFYMIPICVNGIRFDCTERLFHLMKFVATAQDGLVEAYKQPAGMRMKMHIKSMYKTHPDWFRPDWGHMVVDAMKFCLQTKYEQSEMFRNELEASKGYFILEDETARKKGRGADSWGCVLQGTEYVGPNLLGRLLMELRDAKSLPYILPADALNGIEALRQINVP